MYAEISRIVASLEANAMVVGCDVDPLGNVGVMIWHDADSNAAVELIKQAFAAENVAIEYIRPYVSTKYFTVFPKKTR